MPYFMRDNIDTLQYGDNAMFQTGSEGLPRDTDIERNI
jgi:hypothetical protein